MPVVRQHSLSHSHSIHIHSLLVVCVVKHNNNNNNNNNNNKKGKVSNYTEMIVGMGYNNYTLSMELLISYKWKKSFP